MAAGLDLEKSQQRTQTDCLCMRPSVNIKTRGLSSRGLYEQ